MTTYNFEDDTFTYTKSGANIYLGGNTVYTVPTGKIAKVEFDSFHLSQSANDTFNNNNITFYSQTGNAIRKHMFLLYRGSSGDLSSLHWYNPYNYGTQHGAYGGTSDVYMRTMSSQPQDWSANGTIDTTPDSNTVQTEYNSSIGAMSFGPRYFYMKAGEILKVIARGEFATSPSSTFYGNSRFMIFLEDA